MGCSSGPVNPVNIEAPQGVLRQAAKRIAGAGRSSVRGTPAGPKDLRERLEGSLEDVGGAHENAHERIPAQPGDAGGAGVSHQADGRLLLRRRRGPAAGFRAAEDQELGQASWPVLGERSSPMASGARKARTVLLI